MALVGAAVVEVQHPGTIESFGDVVVDAVNDAIDDVVDLVDKVFKKDKEVTTVDDEGNPARKLPQDVKDGSRKKTLRDKDTGEPVQERTYDKDGNPVEDIDYKKHGKNKPGHKHKWKTEKTTDGKTKHTRYEPKNEQ